MEVSSGILFVGVALTLLGAFLVYLSLRAGPRELDAKAVGVIFIGPIPSYWGVAGNG